MVIPIRSSNCQLKLFAFKSDVSPALIMKKVNDASGAKYSVHKEAPKRSDPIAPVGSSYKPVGAPDIAALRKTAKPDVISKVVGRLVGAAPPV
jgi:hypothetical protein